MARKPDIQYIRYYTDGSAAQQVEPQSPRRRSTLPKPRKRKRYTVQVDLLAIGGILVSAVLLIMMIVGAVQLTQAQRQRNQMADYVHQLQLQNQQLEEQYAAGYDLEEVEQAALALGMIPSDQAQHITISVERPQRVAEPTFWERVQTFFAALAE